MVSVGKEYMQTLFSAQYVQNGFTNGAVGDLSRVADGFRCCCCLPFSPCLFQSVSLASR